MSHVHQSAMSAVLVSVFALGAAAPARAQVPTPAADEKVVVITVVNGKVTVDQDPVRIKVDKETVHWYCATADPTITFKKHPFAAKPKHAGRHVATGKALKGTEKQKFHYVITLTLTSGATATLDPDVEVMP